MSNIGGGRAVRVCDLCGGVDDHPRHVIAGYEAGGFPPPGDDIVNRVLELSPPADRARLIRELTDTSASDRHLDCCAAAGCPTRTCGPQVRDVSGTGQEMLDHILGLADAVPVKEA